MLATIPWVQLVWDKYYTRNRAPIVGTNFRGSYWWRDLLKLIDKFKGMAMVTVKDGKSCFFWLDLWNGRVLSQAFPELFSFVKNQHSTVYLVTSSASFHDNFHLPLSPEAFSQFLNLQLLCNIFNFRLLMILGHIFGVPIFFLLDMLIGILSDAGQSIQHSNGFGNPAAKIKGIFSSG